MKENRKATGLEAAVIGMSARFPGAARIDEFWKNLENGMESISFFRDEELEEAGITAGLLKNPNYVKAFGEFEDKEYFDNFFFGYSPKEAKSMDPQIRVFHECSWEALENAGYDSISYDGSIGVYAGASDNFSWRALEMMTGMVEDQGASGPGIFNNALLFLSTSLSYKLDLTGPSITFFTACSTSLVAVHLACRALATGECDMALAGGVSIARTNKTGYLYQEGNIFSPDGHCRPFDAKAQGMLFGEGVGVVVLKRLKDAAAHGDNIIAIVKGSSVNNDGIDKSSFTAPSKKRIARVIRKALAVSRVDPETITYVETHGTATPLGDPIEIGALTRAFNTPKKQFCRIGSVKSNIGHLDVAAGIAGFIKTILALKYKLIPPSLHFEEINPKIDLDNSPFKVNKRLFPWNRIDGIPLRAGVNSAGFGGTNAFIILEEAPAPGEQETGDRGQKRLQLIVLSAKTRSALDKSTENLAAFLEENPGINLADAAYTLQVGRKGFQNRKMLVCRDRNDAIAQLSNPADIKTFLSRVENRDIIFMFPGQGSQYVNMGLHLYEKEPVFREEMDRCLKILDPLMDDNIKEILYPGDSVSPPRDNVDPPGFNRSDRSNTSYKSNKSYINQTEVAQPLIFVIEYALAKLLIHRGIKPGFLIGHSIGEYVAACLAGVFSLEDALLLVSLRGKLMQEMPAGSMLSAAVSLEALEPLLNEELSLAAVNGPSHCVVSGPDNAIETFEQLLRQKEYKSTRLHTSHAFHSKMMDPILARFEEAVGKLKLNKPQIPFISNLTGDWITGEEVTAPAYWANHLRKTVYFSRGLEKLLEKEHSIFVEVGPGQVLSKLVKQHPGKNPDHLVINLVRHPREDTRDDYFLLDKIGMLWLYGLNIHWPGFYMDEKRHRIPLPAYPFERHRYWLDGNVFSKISTISSTQKITKTPDISGWFYLPLWKQAAAARPITVNTGAAGEQSCWLVFVDSPGIGTAAADLLRKQAQDVVIVKTGKEFEIREDSPGTYSYVINPTRPGHYKNLFREMEKLKKIPRQILHLWSLWQPRPAGDNPGSPGGALTTARAEEAQERGFYSLLYLVKGLKDTAVESIHITVVTNNVQSVCGEEYTLPGQSTVLGPVNVIPQEKPSIGCSNIDICLPPKGKCPEQRLAKQLLAELSAESREKMVALRDNRRWLPIYEPIYLDEPGDRQAGLKEAGVYLVTGGLGSIGLVLAEYLARTVKAKLILTGRSAFPPEPEWDQWLNTHQDTEKISRGIRAIRKIRELGGEALAVRADVALEEEMQAAVLQAEENFGPLNGVIHAAGIDGESYFKLFEFMEKPLCEAHFLPKMQGLMVLARVLEGKALDFVLVMSSLSAILGGLRFSAYSAANIFMDYYLQRKNREDSFPWLSVNWDAWQLKGDGFETLSMNKEEGTRAFQRVLSRLEQGRLINSVGDLQARVHQWIKLKDLKQNEEEAGETSPTHSLYARENLSSSFTAPRTRVEEDLLDIWQNIFGFGNLGIHDDFFELGGDSLSLMTVSAKIHKKLNVEVPLTEFFSNPTIEKLARYIDKAGEEKFVGIEPVETKQFYPVSPAQKSMYILQQLDKDSVGYNETETFFLEHLFDKEKFESILSQLIDRHESLRTSFHMIGDRPVQRVHNRVSFEIEYYDAEPEAQGAGRSASAIENFIRPFDLSQAPLLRVGVMKTAGNKYTLIYDMHHIITDDISMELFKSEFIRRLTGQSLSPMRLQYKDYAWWQSGEARQLKFEQQEAFWLGEFSGQPPALELPTDFPRPPEKNFSGNTVGFAILEQETLGIKEIVKETGTTLFTVMVSIYAFLLSKLSGQEEIVIGIPVSGRRHPDLEHIIGMFVNTLPIRLHLPGTQPVTGLLAQVKQKYLQAFENQDYPFEKLVEKVSPVRENGRNPLFDVMLNLLNQAEDQGNLPAHLTTGPYVHEQWIAKFDLIMDISEYRDGLYFKIEYSTQLFKPGTIESFINCFKQVVSSIIDNREIKLDDIKIDHEFRELDENVFEDDLGDF
jgi:acyl transferase domain-containing protein/acyl carrier protein